MGQDVIHYALARAADWQRVPARVAQLDAVAAAAQQRSTGDVVSQLTAIRASLAGVKNSYEDSAASLGAVLDAVNTGNVTPDVLAQAARLAATIAGGLTILASNEAALQSFGLTLPGGVSSGVAGFPPWLVLGLVLFGAWLLIRRKR